MYYQRLLKSQTTDASNIFLLYFERKRTRNVQRNPEKHRDGPHCSERNTALPELPPAQPNRQRHANLRAASQAPDRCCGAVITESSTAHPALTEWRQTTLTCCMAFRRRTRRAPFGSWLHTRGTEQGGTQLHAARWLCVSWGLLLP